MSKTCARVINTRASIEHFVDYVLRIDEPEKGDAIELIYSAEKNMMGDEDVPTLTHIDNRDFRYKSTSEREKLRKQICKELIELPRLDDDEKIELTIGGAAPKTTLKKERKAFYMVGLPASGKSGIASLLADASGAYIVDSDYAKRKLPEYGKQQGSASIIHDESEELVFSYSGINLLEHCVKNCYNMVIPKVGGNLETIKSFCGALQGAGYCVYLILVDLDRWKATKRAYERYKITGRYVPLSLIFDFYSNEPTLNYYRIKNSKNSIFSGFAQISTDVEKGEKPILVDNDKIDLLDTLFKAA